MKAILVIDVDDKTKIEFYDVRVWLYNKTTGLDKLYQNVQLKPMPKKKSVICNKGVGKKTHYEESKYVIGFNDCIDEILGDTE